MVVPQTLKATKRRGFLIVPCGGAGGQSAEHFRQAYLASGATFPTFVLAADTEPSDNAAADFSLDLGMKAEDVPAIRANPGLVGPVAELMVEHYSQFLTPASITHGSRTFRPLTMLAVEYHLERVILACKEAIRELIRNHGVDTILPVFVSSTGGGAGSGLVVIHGLLFADPAFVARVTEGLGQHVLDTPVAVVSEPFAHASANYEIHAAKILANAYAFRIETARLERCFQYIFHLGMANRGGVLVDDIQEVSRVLGRTVFAFCRHFDYLKARFVDTWDSAQLTERYPGLDTPEHRLPKELRPSWVTDPPQRPSSHPISLIG